MEHNKDSQMELYQQVILDHNKSPRNAKEMKDFTHKAEGYNPLCGDQIVIYLKVNKDDVIEDIGFKGDGCAISTASASMMTVSLKGKTLKEAEVIFKEFHNLIIGKLDPKKQKHSLGKLKIFSNIWHFPARVKCAGLAWHAMNAALKKKDSVSTE